MIIALDGVLGQDKNHSTHITGGVLTYGPIAEEVGYTLRAVHSINVKPNFLVGFGVGYNKYMLSKTERDRYIGLPIFAQAKYLLSPAKKRSLYGSFDLGYSVSLNKTKKWDNTWSKFEESYGGGVLALPQLGVLWYTKDKKSVFTFSIGYNYQGFDEKLYTGYLNNTGFFSTAIKSDIIPDEYDAYTRSKYHLHRLSIMLGIGF